MTKKERQRMKAIERSRRNTKVKITKRSAEDLERLFRYNFRKAPYGKFKI